MTAALDPKEITLVVIAKEPLPGRAKTRLEPAVGSEGAAAIAAAALGDTLDAVAAAPAGNRLLALDGEPGPWIPPGFAVVPQRGDGLGERIAAAFADAGGPALMIGMDTPQLTPEMIAGATAELCRQGTDAVIGPAEDGGWWALGLRRSDPSLFSRVPMSEPTTGQAQVAALKRCGFSYRRLPPLRDVDTIDDALAVAEAAPGSRFARAVRATGAGGGGVE